MRRWLLLATLLICSSTPAPAAAGDAERPNVLFIAIDDLRPELGCYGASHVHSPNIDALAAEGVLFERTYCQFPVCGPSRASLLSGLYPTQTRFVDNSALVQREAPQVQTLPEVFRRAGYQTISNGKVFHAADDTVGASWSRPPFSLTNWPPDNNHSTSHGPESERVVGGLKNRGPFFERADVTDDTYIDGQTCDKTISDLRRLADSQQPFFLACGLVRPHLPFYAPTRYWELYHADAIAIAAHRSRPANAPRALKSSQEIRSYHDRGVPYNTDEFHRAARHGYYACVSYADALVGRLVTTLEELGIRDETIVVLWGDHGWQLGEHDFWAKNTLLRESARAPLIIHAPGVESAAVGGVVELIDIYPTLCDLAGIPRPSHLQGKSLVTMMRQPDSPGKAAAYIRDTRGHAVVTQEFLYAEYDTGERMLFDHRNDPHEDVNVVTHADYRETAAEMRLLLEERAAFAAEAPR